MSKLRGLNRFRGGFFSLDAALALSVAISGLAMFLLVFSSAQGLAAESADGQSGSLLALRLSGRLLELSSYQSSQQGSGHIRAWEIDLHRAYAIELAPMLSSTGKSYLSFSFHSDGEEILRRESGQKQSEVYCARRLAWCGKAPCALEACIS